MKRRSRVIRKGREEEKKREEGREGSRVMRKGRVEEKRKRRRK